MQQHNLLTYIHYLLKDLYFHCGWQLNWQADWHCIELVLQFEFEHNNPHIQLDVSKDDNSLLYECKVLFVDKDTANFYSNNVIHRVMIDSKKGIATGEVSAILKYLKQRTSQAETKWHDFILDDRIKSFEITWVESEFQTVRNRLIQSNQYNQESLYLPLED